MAAKYEAVVTLPTNGHLYEEDGIPDTLILRAMTTQEEKMLYGSTSGNERIKSMIKACVVEPNNFDINGLISEDFFYLLVKLRILTYGPEYNIETTCPNTNKLVINLDEDLIVNTLPSDFTEPIKIELPMSGDTIGCRLLRLRDNTMIEKLARKMTKSSNVSADEVAFMYRLAKSIVELNGNKIEFPEAQQYVQKMHARDSAFINSQLDKIKVGYDRDIEIEACAQCMEPYETELPMSGEFFRPTFD